MDSWFTLLARTVLILIQPVALLWLGLIALTVVLARSRQRAAAVGAALLLLFVQVIGGTRVPVWMVARLERPFAGMQPEALPVCDAIVLLGGCVEPSANEVGDLHLTTAGDRVAMALELVRLGKAPVLCLGGGTAGRATHLGVEADLLKRAIEARHLAAGPVFSLGACADTHDEALRLRALAGPAGWKRLLLVTSAAHQRRALATFRHAGFEVVPVPCNFLTGLSPEALPPQLGVPSWSGFFLTSIWIHEQIGWLEYRRRGWLGTGP